MTLYIWDKIKINSENYTISSFAYNAEMAKKSALEGIHDENEKVNISTQMDEMVPAECADGCSFIHKSTPAFLI